jgi:hypothetical protein
LSINIISPASHSLTVTAPDILSPVNSVAHPPVEEELDGKGSDIFIEEQVLAELQAIVRDESVISYDLYSHLALFSE